MCSSSDLPVDATALVLNVTALGATSQTFLTFWPSGDRPEAASLNPSPGAPPIPNAVTTQLGDDGSFRVFNERGSVDVVIDVSGYYVDHNHDDRYPPKADVYTKAESDARYADQATLDAALLQFIQPAGTTTVPAAAFRQRVSGAEYEMTGGGIFIPTTETDNVVLEAAISLPDRANLGELRATILDDASGKDLSIDLVRYDDEGVRTVIGTAASAGTAGFAYLEWDTKDPVDERVDNDEYSYVLEASARNTSDGGVTSWPGTSMRLLKVEIDYAG